MSNTLATGAVVTMSRKFRQTPIHLTKHAAIRFEERVPLPWEVRHEVPAPDIHTQRRARDKTRRRLISEIRKRLEAALKLGVEPDGYGAIHIFLEGGYEAVLVPDVGYWTVLTILEPPNVITEHEQREAQRPASDVAGERDGESARTNTIT